MLEKQKNKSNKKLSMITLLLLVPIIGSLIMLPFDEESISQQSTLRKIALTTSLINLIISIFIWFQFDSSTSQYQFIYEFNHISFCAPLPPPGAERRKNFFFLYILI